jgi:hypothetical protein
MSTSGPWHNRRIDRRLLAGCFIRQGQFCYSCIIDAPPSYISLSHCEQLKPHQQNTCCCCSPVDISNAVPALLKMDLYPILSPTGYPRIPSNYIEPSALRLLSDVLGAREPHSVTCCARSDLLLMSCTSHLPFTSSYPSNRDRRAQ